MISLIKVDSSKSSINSLYKLLENRSHAISHSSMPSMSEHKKFVKNSPYRAWYFIKFESNYIGTVYLTFENHISISLPEHKYNHIAEVLEMINVNYEALPEIKSIRPKNYQMNVPLSDISMISTLDKIGYKKIQTTYSISNNQNKIEKERR